MSFGERSTAPHRTAQKNEQFSSNPELFVKCLWNFEANVAAPHFARDERPKLPIASDVCWTGQVRTRLDKSRLDKTRLD